MIPEKDNPRVRVEGRHSGPPHQDQAAGRRTESRPHDHVDADPRTTEPKENTPRVSDETACTGLRAPAKTEKKSIDVVFDLNDPEQAKKLEGHKATLGQGYTEVKPLGDGRVVLRIYPGGAKKGLR